MGNPSPLKKVDFLIFFLEYFESKINHPCCVGRRKWWGRALVVASYKNLDGGFSENWQGSNLMFN